MTFYIMYITCIVYTIAIQQSQSGISNIFYYEWQSDRHTVIKKDFVKITDLRNLFISN